MSLLRALAEDETRAQRAQHGLDLALLDAVTWPEYLWDFLRIVHDPSGHLSSAMSVPQQDPTPTGSQVSLPCFHLAYLRAHAEIIASNTHVVQQAVAQIHVTYSNARAYEIPLQEEFSILSMVLDMLLLTPLSGQIWQEQVLLLHRGKRWSPY